MTHGRLTGVFRYTDLGELGVRVFFVLSGFLITSLLLQEKERRGRISLNRFYFRRTLRIFPAAYTFVLTVTAISMLGVVHLAFGSPFPALAYVSDFVRPDGWTFLHTWSLSVEEQFYLLWPLTVVALGKRGGVRVALAALALCPVIRITLLLAFRHQGSELVYQFECQADALATGCLLACWRDVLWASILYRSVLTSRWFFTVPLLVVGIAENPFKASHALYALYFLAGYTVMNVGVAMCLDWSMRFSYGRVGSLLNARSVVWVGVLSYSIYLWQEIFLTDHSPAFLHIQALNILLVPFAAAASFYLVERPCLRLRGRLESAVTARRSAGRRDIVSEPVPLEVTA
jgi:peptidoglycan/LPS O-acetylase OafA/YrhL